MTKRAFDMERSRKKWKDVLHGKNVLNLKLAFRVRHPWLWVTVLIVAVASIFFGARRLATKAEVKDLFPTTCLGDWNNPVYAAGSAETLAATGTVFGADNSAVNDGSGTQLFCTNFLPSDFATSGVITSVGLTLVWQVGEAPATNTTTSDEVTTDTPSSTQELSPSTSTDETTIDTPNPDATSTTAADDGVNATTSASSSGADIQATTTDNPDGSTPPAGASDQSTQPPADPNAPASFQWMFHFIGRAFADELASDTTQDASTDTAQADPNAPDGHFLNVSYTTNGELWIQLQKVDLSNWPNLTVALPITKWSDLANLEIKIENIPTSMTTLPPVYLDGMFAEVHYNAPTDISANGETPEYPQFLTDKSAYTQGDPVHVVGVPDESSIEIYALDNPDSPDVPANTYAIDVPPGGEVDIDSGTLAPGRYILVNTFEPGSCGGYTLPECEARSDYIGEARVVITPSLGN